LRAAAVVRYEGASGAGHVGWAFDASAMLVNCGSVENPSGFPTCPVLAMGFWDAEVADPVPEFEQRKYVDIKFVDLATPDIAKATSTIAWVRLQPYAVISRNCLDDVYDVLCAYGVRDLPAPSHDYLPNEWFGMWAGSGVSARLTTFTWPRPQDAPAAAALERLAVPEPAAPVAPAWRTAGTPEWEALQTKLAAASSREPYRQHAIRQMAQQAPR
jgi:hypothetical protein